ncbi:putative mitochondrial hypothetical protein [Leptomonas pyrrhocoris]|uniref:Centromere protein J C-terminal domain-containing protein n=1 Tax=Leptomonas pyrrhocoris TaxID=157538 RepID=A0A0M9FUL3_LEPPY|nr:putative mitochondrial hypothetical protein [Leptomonas pyrrhocoris]KPA76343.1 putative mitochondrial hypothetical protein [Leptomonas pyrrhocoris]|eukprot:XP_015654782.1 putative mitochondrial hypothetical protein [Leptomonas pyrrhocoris]
MSRVSVAAGSKPKPKESFKFLRRDEGRLSYSAGGTAESPARSVGNGSEGDKTINRERRDSKSLREAIAFDMRNAKSHDPLGEVVVAVPRKAPPPNRAASTPPTQTNTHTSNNNRSAAAGSRGESRASAQQQPRRSPASAAAFRKRPEWIDPEIPPARVDAAAVPEYDLPQSSASRNSEDEGGVAEYGRYGGRTPRRAGGGAPVPRYVDADYADYADVSAAQPSNVDRNFFRRPQNVPAPPAASSRTREEEDLMVSLEQEIRAAQEEREHYDHAKQQLEREKQRFEAYRFNAQKQLEDERLSADGNRARDQRDAQKDLRSAEERCKNVSALLVTEREANRRLSQENDSLRAQLEDLTSTLREAHQMHKTEAARMRRDIDSLTRRNAELLAMAKEQQLSSLEENNTKTKPAPALWKAGAGSRHVSAARDRSSAPQTPSLDAGEPSASERRTSAQSTTSSTANNHSAPQVMDFTPRANAGEEAARERRNRQMQERIQAEQAEMEERRRQREADMARREEEEAARREEEEAERQRQREKQEKERRERGASTASSAATAAKPVEERKSAGHPVNTPRMQSSGAAAAAAAKKRLPVTAPHPPVPPKPSRIVVPTREELLGDMEQAPEEDFPNDSAVSETALGDNPNKKETLYRSGKREIHYANGTVKAVLPSGHTILHFTNGDVKCTFPSGKSTYWYDAAQTAHTQMQDGVQTFEFRTTGQVERHLPDGSKSILYPDGIYKVVHKDGSDETYYPDGEPMEE